VGIEDAQLVATGFLPSDVIDHYSLTSTPLRRTNRRSKTVRFNYPRSIGREEGKRKLHGNIKR